MRAVTAHKPETSWPVMDSSAEFLWSVAPLQLVEAVKSDGEVIYGYLRGFHRDNGSIQISPHNNLQESRCGIGARTLKSFRKFRVDRLGRRFEVEREVRTWRGKACT